MASIGDRERGVKLIGVRLSPFVVRILISLRIKGIPYEFIEENLWSKSQLLLKSNPIHKKVPVLIHGGKPVCESLVILEYVDEIWPSSPRSLLPADPYDRALARFWASFVDANLVENLRPICVNPDRGVKKKAAEEVVSNLVTLEESLKTSFGAKMFFGGETVGFVDIVLGSLFTHFKAAEEMSECVLIDEEKMPLLSAWMKRFCESEAARGLLPDPTSLVRVFTEQFQKTQETPE